MKESDIESIRAWLTERGLAGDSETTLVQGFSARCEQAGLALTTTAAVMDTLHPVWEGRAFFWRKEGVPNPTLEYDSTLDVGPEGNWKHSVFHHLIETGGSEFRCIFARGKRADFNWLEKLVTEGHTDYLALVHRFTGKGGVGKMDAVFSHWATQKAEGFSEEDCAALRRLVPLLALALKCISESRSADTLAEVYLGKDAGQLVRNGRIGRGVTEQIRAVLWLSDLKGYTAISDSVVPGEIIPLLDDYADAVISAVHQHGGDVMKLMGDGILAIFQGEDAAACEAAMQAAEDMQTQVDELNARRSTENRPTTSVRLGLHIGDVFYGNIGNNERLDFTVVGPAVNEVSRITAMGLSVDRDFLVSDAFIAAAPRKVRTRFVSAGRFALRGVRRTQELFTPDPASGIEVGAGNGSVSAQ